VSEIPISNYPVIVFQTGMCFGLVFARAISARPLRLTKESL
jgi:hypothetical protein